MHLILGGRYMGKRIYAEKLYGPFDIMYDMDKITPDNITRAGLITNIHSGVKSLMLREVNAYDFFMARLGILKHSVITGDDISCGVVPLDEFSRRWRDETGRLYQALALEADIVDRIFAGLALRLKG